MAKTAIAYKEKMKELSVISLICSCFYPETRNKLVCEFEVQPLPSMHAVSLDQDDPLHLVPGEAKRSPIMPPDMQVKPIDKRASGQAFEVILKPPSPVSDAAHSITSPPKKRDVSLEDIQKKLEAAEDRRRSQEAQVLRALAEKREHERDVLLKAMEENSNFSKMAEEKLTMKMEQIKENRQAYLASIMERLQEREKHAMEVRRNKELREELTA